MVILQKGVQQLQNSGHPWLAYANESEAFVERDR